jgi:hypothetical protein
MQVIVFLFLRHVPQRQHEEILTVVSFFFVDFDKIELISRDGASEAHRYR